MPELRKADLAVRHRIRRRAELSCCSPRAARTGSRTGGVKGRGDTMETTRDKSSRLGRGFSALMPGAAAAPAATDSVRTGVLLVAIEDILPDKTQPRRSFHEGGIDELAASIRSKGVIQPILVRRDGPRYRIVAGERRWRASQKAGLKNLPVLVK